MTIFTKIENWLSKFPSITQIFLALLAVGISGYSLWTSKQNQKRIQEQEKIYNIPNWNTKINYDTDNLTISYVKLYSLNKDLIIKYVKIIPPSDYRKNNDLDSIIGDEIPFQSFSNNIIRTIQTYFELPDRHISENMLYNLEFQYPVCFKVAYIEHGITKLSYAVFYVHLRVYSENKYRVFNLEPVYYLTKEEVDDEQIKDKIDSLNRLNGIIALFNNVNDSCNQCFALLRNNIYYRYLIDLIQLSKMKIPHVIVYIDASGKAVNTDTVKIPEFFTSREENSRFMMDLSIIVKKIKQFPDSIICSINRIDSFVDKYHLALDYDSDSDGKRFLQDKLMLRSFDDLISQCNSKVEREAEIYFDEEEMKKKASR